MPIKTTPFLATCPHCFSRINLLHGVFRCVGGYCNCKQPDCTCGSQACVARKDVSVETSKGQERFRKGEEIPKREDARLRQVWDDANPKNHTFAASGLVPPVPFLGAVRKRAKCPFGGHVTTDRLCPNCHKSLYSKFGEVAERRLTVIGASGAGKSNYISVVVREMQDRFSGQFGFSFWPMHMDMGTEYEENYRRPVFDLGQVVKVTPNVTTRRNAVAPMVFTVQRISDGEHLSTISFFDPPGEGVVNERNIERFHHFVFNSQGLVLLVDGEKLLDPKGQDAAFNEATTVLQNASRQLEAQRGWMRRLRPYLAITISKADLLASRPDVPAELATQPRHDRGFDENDFRVLSSEIETLIRKRGGGNFCNVAQSAFGPDRVGFFAVSALGASPDPRTLKLTKLDPLRVADPLLWLMIRTGVLKQAGA